MHLLKPVRSGVRSGFSGVSTLLEKEKESLQMGGDNTDNSLHHKVQVLSVARQYWDLDGSIRSMDVI